VGGGWSRDRVALSVQFPIHAQEVPEIRRILANVKCARLVDDLAFSLGQSFLHQEVLGPGWIHHFHAVSIWSTEVFVQTPTEGAIPQVNQTDFTQNIEHFPSEHTIDFDIKHDRNRTVMRRWNMN
jgi:hypothetical protein